MSKTFQGRGDGHRQSFRLGILAILAGLSMAASADRNDSGAYVQRNLVSDGSIPAEHIDPGLVSPWGIAPSPAGLLWIAGNGTSAGIAYDAQGNPLPALDAVDIPGGSPTGIVRNDTGDFLLSAPDGNQAPSTFIFVTEGGVISAWNPSVDPTAAFQMVNNSQSDATYKGVAIAGSGGGSFLYATDFHGAKVDVFDGNFRPVRLPAGAFRDPSLPAGFAPFGIQNINGILYVTYARQDDLKEESVPGPGLGFIDAYAPNGRLLRRLVSRGNLNAPWGMALAPADFGPFGNYLLVANSGDGRINAYHPVTGEFRGLIRDPANHPIAIDGLWGICFGRTPDSRSASTLFFTAGPALENTGLYGRIEQATGLAAPGGTGAPQAQLGKQPPGRADADMATLLKLEAEDEEKAHGQAPRAAPSPKGQGQRGGTNGRDEDDALNFHAPNPAL